MTGKRILGIVILIGAVTMIYFSYYIKTRVNAGKGQISDAQKKVDTADSLFSLSPATKDFGKGLTGSAQKKIDEGQVQIDQYERLASFLQIGGIVLVVVGVGVILVGGRKRQ